MLSDRQLARIKPGMHADGGGLYIRVSPKGKKVWVKRVRANGADRWVRLGAYPSMPLAEARRIASGVTPEVNMEQAIDQYVSAVRVVRPEQLKWLFAALRSKPLDIERKEVVELLQGKARTAPTMANRMLTRWKDFFNFCTQSGWLEHNPLEGVQRRFIGGKEKSRNRVLSWEELKAVRNPVLLFILLTGLRPSEALWALRHKKTTDIPNKRTPSDGYLHTLPHSHLVRFLISRSAKVPASHLTLSNSLRRAGATYRPHDLRRTFVTRLADLGIAPHIVEKLVGHKMQGVMAVYNHSEYWPERHAAQRVWDRKLLSLWKEVRNETRNSGGAAGG